jgi:hypothetical protein
MNGNKIGVLGGINIIFMVIKLSFWAQAFIRVNLKEWVPKFVD